MQCQLLEVSAWLRWHASACTTPSADSMRLYADQVDAVTGSLLDAPAQVVPAPGVEAVSEREFKQFLSDVLTAAGLVTHGKKCKDLGRRLGEMSMRLLTAPKTTTNTAAVETMRAAIGQLLNEFGERQWQSGRGVPHKSLEEAFDAIIERAALATPAQPVAWLHDCAALLTNDVELWIDACPHCGKPHNAPQPVAVPAAGPVGFDHKTAANFLNGKTVTDEEVRRFVAHSRWAHDDRDGLRNTIADLRREIAQRDAEIALLKALLLDSERGAPAPASQPFAYEFSRSNGDGTHSEHIERGRLQEVAPGRWEHSGLPRGVLADKSIKALYTTPQTQPAAVPAGMEPVALLKFAVWDDGELRLLSGRKGPAFDCELYAMPDGKRAPDLFTAAQVQAMLAGAPTPPLTNIGDKP